MKDILEKIIISAVTHKKLSEDKFGKIKREFLKNKRIRSIPQNTELIPIYRKLVKSGKISANQTLENILRKKKMRTLSGIASITVITPDFGCPGKCIYCPTERGMPKSYLSNEPAVMRAIANKFDPYLQVASRLKMLKAQGHPTDKIELIIAGGTWSAIPENYQIWFVKECFRAANLLSLRGTKQSLDSPDFRSRGNDKNESGNDKGKGGSPSEWAQADDRLLWKKLDKEQKRNETTKNRIVGLTLETRPDWINEQEIKKMRFLGCTRVELGVQSIYDDILKKCARGHTVKETIEATKLLKNAGFKINYHIMLGLPGSTPKRDEKMLEELFINPDFQPDMLKIYPCVVLKGTPLYKLYKSGKYRPYSDKQIVNILKKAKTKIPEYCRIVRVIRDIPTSSIIAGGKISNLREIIHREMARENKQCRCIRCREIKDIKFKAHNLKLKRIDYPASGGQEIFLSFEDAKNDKLVALLRLRIISTYGGWQFPEPAYRSDSKQITEASEREAETAGVKRLNFGGIPEGSEDNLSVAKIAGEGNCQPPKNTAIIREAHTYGQMERINEQGETQHLGLGRKLIKEAEGIAKKEFGISKISIISGVGARNYYRKLGYKLKDTYMIKKL